MLTLIDGNSLLFRAYYGVHSRLTRSDGTPTGAVYGFFNMILPILAAANHRILLYASLMHRASHFAKIYTAITRQTAAKHPLI